MLEAQRRRVGLDEDGPEDLHVLAGARLDVLVQDVDAPLCEPITIHESETRIIERARTRNQSQSGDQNSEAGEAAGARTLVLRGMHADPELLERRQERLQPRHGEEVAAWRPARPAG